MKKSNIFAYIELSKLVDGLKKNPSSSGKLKEQLKSQSAYFNIIEPRYFSDSLVAEWEGIQGVIKKRGAKLNEEGRVVSNAVMHTIEYFTDTECQKLVERIENLYARLKKEFE